MKLHQYERKWPELSRKCPARRRLKCGESSLGMGGSIYSNYLFSASVLGLKEVPEPAYDSILKTYSKLKAKADAAQSPSLVCAIPYDPVDFNEIGQEPVRAAAGRAVVFYLAAMHKARNVAERAAFRQALQTCLTKGFTPHLAALRAHYFDKESHFWVSGQERKDQDNLAPYYLLPSAPYAMAAFHELLNSKPLSSEDKSALEIGRSDLIRTILSLQEPSGTFREMDKTMYSQSSAYVKRRICYLPTPRGFYKKT